MDQALPGPHLLAAGGQRQRTCELHGRAGWASAADTLRCLCAQHPVARSERRSARSAAPRHGHRRSIHVDATDDAQDRRSAARCEGHALRRRLWRYGGHNRRASSRRHARGERQLRRRAAGKRSQVVSSPLLPRRHLHGHRQRARRPRQSRHGEASGDRAMRHVALVQAGVITTILLLVLCAPVRADAFGPISLASDNALEQADYAHDPVISGNGEFIAFDGYFEGLTGVWRRDLKAPYAVEAGSVGERGTPAGSAELPSISENGQYVSFATAAALSPVNDTNVGPDVYVRDMDVPEEQPCAEEEALAPA